MCFLNFFDIHKEKLQSIYDLAALSYDYIIESVSDEELFIGKYILYNEDAKTNNPNIDRLLSFVASIIDSFKKISSGKEQEDMFEDGQCLLLEDLLLELYSKMDNAIKELCTYEDDEENKTTLVYCLLMAIDIYSKTTIHDITGIMPLNEKYNEKSFVYKKTCASLMDEAKEKLRFSDCVRSRSINDCLKNINLVERSILKNGMKPIGVYPINFDYTIRKKIKNVENKRLDVAVIPFNGFSLTKFVPENGTLFNVEYDSDYKAQYLNRFIELLDLAISKQVNIIMFPEYVCSPEIQKEIGKHLEEIYSSNPERLSELLFVIAGTGWESENNIMKIYDRSGYLIGNNYKVAKFINKNLTENLKTPGKERIIIDVESIGRFLPAICRDISDGRDIENLIDKFRPFEVLVSAWSKSINRGFKDKFKSFATDYHLSSILCNSCEPFHIEENQKVMSLNVSMKEKEKTEAVNNSKEANENFRNDTQIVVTPKKDEYESIVESIEYIVERKHNCNCQCEEKKCMFLITMEFSTENVKDGNIVTNCEQLIE